MSQSLPQPGGMTQIVLVLESTCTCDHLQEKMNLEDEHLFFSSGHVQ